MKLTKMVLISVFSFGAIFTSSSLAEQLESIERDAGTQKQGKHMVYRLTDAEKREIEEQSLQLHLQEMKASPQKGDNPFGTSVGE